MRQNNEKSINKIKKLLALASSPNEHEAQSALLKAQELLAKHNLSMSDIEVEEQAVEQVVNAKVDASFSKMRWRLYLAVIIADNFRCYCWGNTSASKGYGVGVTFLGKESDVEVCKTMYIYAKKFVESNIRRMQRELNSQGYKSTGVGNSYGTGFCTGLKKQFDKQKEVHQEWGLVLVKPDDVVKAYNELSGDLEDVTPRDTLVNTRFYNKGIKDGEEFAPNAVTTTTSKQQTQLLLGQ